MGGFSAKTVLCSSFGVRSICVSFKTFWKSLINGWYVRLSTGRSSTWGFLSLLSNFSLDIALALRICSLTSFCYLSICTYKYMNIYNICNIYDIYIYNKYIYIDVYICYRNLPVNAIVRLPHPPSGHSQGQKTFLAPSAEANVQLWHRVLKPPPSL